VFDAVACSFAVIKFVLGFAFTDAFDLLACAYLVPYFD
jgi:hypothetical protein